MLEIERDAHHVAVEDRVTADSGAAAQIRAGGNLRLSVDQSLYNQYSNIVATGALFIDGGVNAPIVNQAMTLYRTHSFDGAWMDSAGDRTAYTMPNISEAIGSLTGVISGGQGVLITGRSFSNIDVNADLHDSGIGYAKQWNLCPRIALTASQIRHLTSIVNVARAGEWLTQRTAESKNLPHN